MIVRLLPLLDEEDILERNLRWYAEAGIITVAFDNASADRTAEVARAALTAGTLASLQRSEEQISWRKVAQGLIELARAQRPDAVLIAAADEFVETADGTPLRTAIEKDLARGADVLTVDTMEFCLTEEDDVDDGDPVARMHTYAPRPAVLRERAVRWSTGIAWSRPHELKILDAEATRSPRRYINRHYPVRSTARATARARSGRLRRSVLAGHSVARLASLLEAGAALTVPADKLPRYEEDHRWSDDGDLAGLRVSEAARVARSAIAQKDKLAAKVSRQQEQHTPLNQELRSSHRQASELRAQLARLRQDYAEASLERDRLVAGGARPVAGKLAAPAGWYDEQYRLTLDKYDSGYGDSVYLPVWEAIADRIDAAARVLEIGCGTAQLASLLVDRGLRHYRGFDFSEYAIELARKRLTGFELEVADARTTDLLSEATYDTAICTEVLEHLDDDVALLTRIRPGTRVLASVPNFHATSHLRFFTDEAEVADRYRPVLRDLEVTRIALPRDSAIFLLDGRAAAADPVPR